jgi:hypothetical protein
VAGNYSFTQLEQLWEQAGGKPEYAPIAAGIALAESGGNPSAVNKAGAPAVGLWQINGPHQGVLGGQWNASVQQQLQNPLTNAQAAVEVSGNGATWQPWVSDPVGLAASQSPQVLSASQVQSILSGNDLSTGTASAPAATTSGTTGTSGNVFGIPTTPPSAPSGLGAANIGGDLVWFGQFAAWSVFTALVFLFGLILILLGLVMLGVVLLGPVVGPAGELIPGPVGQVVRGTSRARRGSSAGAPGRTAAAVGRPIRARTSSRTTQRNYLERENVRHEHRMIETEHRASASRYGRQRPGSFSMQDEEPL